MQETTISLQGTTKPFDSTKIYMVDFSKMTSVNDLILVLASMAIAFPGTHPNIEALKPFLNLDNPIDGPNTQPQAKEIALPKLKTIKPNGEQ
jgi:hypothetical protein